MRNFNIEKVLNFYLFDTNFSKFKLLYSEGVAFNIKIFDLERKAKL
jgi:hypothetical protein